MKKLCDVLKIALFAVAIFALVGCPDPNSGKSDPVPEPEKEESASTQTTKTSDYTSEYTVVDDGYDDSSFPSINTGR